MGGGRWGGVGWGGVGMSHSIAGAQLLPDQASLPFLDPGRVQGVPISG